MEDQVKILNTKFYMEIKEIMIVCKIYEKIMNLKDVTKRRSINL